MEKNREDETTQQIPQNLSQLNWVKTDLFEHLSHFVNFNE
jgi:hypothetical protein